MSVTPSVLLEAKYAENSQTTQFTQGTGKAIIDKFTVTNVTASNATLGVNLVASGGAASAANLIVDDRIIAPGESYTLPSVVGHVLNSGDFISTIADTASALVIRISGRLITY